MKYWEQTAKELNPIRSWGCYQISIINLAQLLTGTTYTAKQIIEGWYKDYQDGDIDIESTCLNPIGILEDLGITNITFVGKKPADYKLQENEYEILEFYNKFTDIVHFVLGDGNGKCLFDPYPNSVTVAKGVLRSKRIFAKKGN